MMRASQGEFMTPAAPHPFERKLVERSNNLLIESRCRLCGFRIVGSATHTLRQDEDDHAERCPRSEAAATQQSAG